MKFRNDKDAQNALIDVLGRQVISSLNEIAPELDARYSQGDSGLIVAAQVPGADRSLFFEVHNGTWHKLICDIAGTDLGVGLDTNIPFDVSEPQVLTDLIIMSVRQYSVAYSRPIHLLCQMSNEDMMRLQTGGIHSGTDRLAKQVREFCKNTKLPYSTPFTSIAVVSSLNNVRGMHQAYGAVTAVLGDTVLQDCIIACQGDFQDVAYNGYHECRTNKKVAMRRANEKFLELNGGLEVRAESLARFRAKYAGSLYVEARVFRPITLSDVLEFQVS